MNLDRRAFLSGAAAVVLARRAASAEPRIDRNVVYARPGGLTLLMDLYRPARPGPHPPVLLVHGGGWLGGSKEGYAALGPRLAGHGFAACAINYRLAPHYPYPAAFDDCQRAVRWLRAHAGEWDLDPDHVGAMGDSAGGHLVALIGVRNTRDNSDRLLRPYRSRPDAVVSNYGAHELVSMWNIEMAHKPLTAWLGGPPDQFAQVYREASPVSMADRKSPPFLIVHGDKDAVNPEGQSRMLHKALRKKGADSTLLILPGAGHGWAPDSETGRRAETATVEFLNRHLKRHGR